MKILEALEAARCAEINVDNVVRIIPALKNHPMVELVKMQIRQVISLLDGGNDETEPQEGKEEGREVGMGRKEK